ncbi:MAG: (2Fe-2S)-binding protein [Solimonas sp.]
MAAMFICVCKAVSDRMIHHAVREDGVTSLRELARGYGLGTCCGKCVPQARELLGAALREQEDTAIDTVIPLAALPPSAVCA